METEYRLLEPTKVIEENLPTLIEVFVEFYGEEQRERIEERFNNLLVIGYTSPERLSSILIDIERMEASKLISSFFQKVGLEETEETKKIFFDSSLDYPNMLPLHHYYSFLSMDKSDEWQYNNRKKQVLQFLKKINLSVNEENLEEMISKKAFIQIDEMRPFFEELLNSYNEVKKNLASYQSYVEASHKLDNNIKVKWTLRFLEEFADIIPKEELEEIRKDFARGIFYIPISAETAYFIFGSFEYDAKVTCFSLESERILKEDPSSWRAESIASDRMEFFKSKGINLGEVYQAYEESLECQNIRPSFELVERLENRKQHYRTLYKNEYYQQTDDFLKNAQKITNANLLIEDNGLDAKLYENRVTCVSPNLDSNFNLCPILYFNVALGREYLDNYLIHELNHIYELDIHKIEDGSVTFCSGWDSLVGETKKQKESVVSLKPEERRPYELKSEYVNEVIAQQITKRMHDKGIYIFNTPENAKVKGGTSYEHLGTILLGFYEQYRSYILDSRRTGNMQILFDVVGKENFDALNNLANRMNERFGESYNYYRMLQDLNNEKKTEDTVFFEELISKSRDILNKMNEYNKSQTGAVSL